MQIYLQTFVYFKQNDWAQFLPMIQFAHNNAKNANTGYILFEFNCKYYSRISYKKDLNLHLKSRIAKEFFSKL